MCHKIKSIRPLNRYKVSVVFENGEKKVYDAGCIVSKFGELKSGNAFRKAEITPNRDGISWGGIANISCSDILGGDQRW